MVSCSIVKGQRKRMIFDHRIWKEFGVEVGEGTEMRSVKSVMEHNHVADQIDKWEKKSSFGFICEEIDFIGDAYVDR